ncbi:MAG: hypothetical protein ABR915_01525, partial [Thermoguttaceae bacterium]
MNVVVTGRFIFGAAAAAAAAVAVLVAAGTMAADKPLPEPPKSAPGQIRRLVAELGDKDYFVRERAEKELAKLGFEAFDALGEAAASEDLEVAVRAGHLLGLMKIQWADKNDPAEVKQILHDYESQNTDARQAAMRSLAELPGAAGVPALCRLVRYEKSAILSKHAAVLLLGDPKSAVPPKKAVAEMLGKNLANCRRAAAAWLLTWARSGADPQVMADEWGRLVEAEQTLADRLPVQTSPEILAALRRIQIAWLCKLGRTADLLAAVDRLLDSEKGDPEVLGSLLGWLTEQKDWKTVDHLAEQFAPLIAADPGLSYDVAAACADRGDAAQAEELARRAFGLYPGKEPEHLQRHLQAAFQLQTQGRTAWSKREYRHVIDSGAPVGGVALVAEHQLSEVLHDRGED